MNKLTCCTALLGLSISMAIAQEKMLDSATLLKGNTPTTLLKPLPTIAWLDAETYQLSVPGKESLAVDATTGNAAPLLPKVGTARTAPAISLRDNDLYAEMPGDALQVRLTNNADPEKNATLSPNNQRVAFTRNNDLYCIDLATKAETRLTTDGSKTTLNGYATWVYWEEIFGRATRFKAFWWSPDSKTIAYMRFDESAIPMFPLYNADGVHGTLEETRYPKVGDPNPAVQLGFVAARGGKTKWVDFGETSSHQLGWPKFTPDGNALMVQWQNRGQDTLRLFAVNPNNGRKTELYQETQSTWIDLSDADKRLTFIKNGAEMLVESDKTGWNHLYRYDKNGVFKNVVTQGQYRVVDVKYIDEAGEVIYFTGRTKASSAETHLFSVRLSGQDLKQLTPSGFNHNVTISPSGKYFLSTASNVSQPASVALFTANGTLLRQVASAKGDGYDQYRLAKTELVRIPSADGKFELPATVTWPTNMQPGKTYPILISIYGGPDAGTVMNNWMWSGNRQWYAQEGLIQVAFDHRASGHFGKAGVNYMHRNLGYWEMEDYKTMAKWFINKGYADSSKVCITGFSYGGYMSCYALTYGADVFTHGMAGGSVVDWNLYDSHYTERFMDLPSENPEGYKTSSVLSHVAKYKGMLQIVHGTMDDNVHLQNSLQLVGALQDLKKDFDFMVYPNGRHGWRNLPARNSHFDNLKTQFIYKHLLQKAVPVGLLK